MHSVVCIEGSEEHDILFVVYASLTDKVSYGNIINYDKAFMKFSFQFL